MEENLNEITKAQLYEERVTKELTTVAHFESFPKNKDLDKNKENHDDDKKFYITSGDDKTSLRFSKLQSNKRLNTEKF